MNIEKLVVNPHHSYEYELYTKKINEIIDILQSRELLDSFVTITLPDLIKHLENTFESAKTFDDRLTNLEQCLIDDVRQCHIPKPEYDPDDVKLKKELPINDILNAIIDDVDYLYKEFGLLTEPTAPSLSKGDTNIAKKGSFEWALCMMKQGKSLYRGNIEYGRYFLRPKSTLTCLSFQVEGCDTQQWTPSHDAILANDWEIC